MDTIFGNASLNVSQFINPNIEEMGLMTMALVLFVSLLASLFISSLYVFFYGKDSTGSQIHRALPMLGLSITGIFITIQFSLPLSLGLLGALSIIRFRTPIKEPEEIGFIMLVIAVSLGCATFNLYFLVAFLLIAIIGLLILKVLPHYGRSHITGGVLLLKMPSAVYDENEEKIISNIKDLNSLIKLQSLSRDDQKTTLTYDLNGVIEFDQAKLVSLFGRVNPAIELDVYLNDTRISAY